MPFMDLMPRRRRSRWGDYLILAASGVASLVVSGWSHDDVTGPARMADALGLTAAFLAVGCLLTHLPTVWLRARRTAWEPWITPAFVGLSLTYFYLAFRSYFVQPGATGPVVLLQLLVLIGASCRAAALGPG